MAELSAARNRRRFGITMRRRPATASTRACDALDAEWGDWISDALHPHVFVAIPNFSDPCRARDFAETHAIDALLLSGGEDIGSSPPRDRVETTLLDLALQRHWPVLGICRGMQMLQHHSGGRLAVCEHALGMPHTILHGAAETTVNSWHRHCIRQLAPGWRSLARAEDGSIEAMSHADRGWLGLMWHPERENGGAALWPRWWLRALAHTSAASHPAPLKMRRVDAQ